MFIIVVCFRIENNKRNIFYVTDTLLKDLKLTGVAPPPQEIQKEASNLPTAPVPQKNSARTSVDSKPAGTPRAESKISVLYAPISKHLACFSGWLGYASSRWNRQSQSALCKVQ
jgi:hypothetical protein